MNDVYSAFAQRLGTSREEAKRRAYQAAYSGEPPRPKVEVLGPNDYVPPLKMARRSREAEEN